MSKTNITYLALLAILLSPMMSNADPLVIGSTGVAGPDRTENFDSEATHFNGVGSEFAASGLQFSTTSGLGIALTTNSICGNIGRGVTNSYLYMGLNAPCGGSNLSDAVSIAFDVNVSELSWTGFHRASGGGFSIQRVLNGIIVETDLFASGNRFENRTVLLAGTVFDELRFVENGTSNRFFALDNFAWNLATPVPEPGTLALFGLGLAGLGLARRKRKI